MPNPKRTKKTLPTVRSVPVYGLGPRAYSFNRPPKVKGGPGDPPPGFLIASTSKSEWLCYWAMAHIFPEPRDPRQPPFVGGPPDWGYQVPFLGGRQVLGSVLDFLVWNTPSGRPVGIRIQTEYFHLFTPTAKQASDLLRRQRLNARIDVVDVFDYTFTGDASGQAAIQVMKAAIGQIAIPDPLRGATARRNPRTGNSS